MTEKAKKFYRFAYKGNCLICECNKAEGHLLFKDGSEWRSCLKCAKSLVKHGKIRSSKSVSQNQALSNKNEQKSLVEFQENSLEKEKSAGSLILEGSK